VDSNIAWRILVIMVLGQFGRWVTEVDEAVRDVGVEILLQRSERRSVGHRNRSAGDWHRIGQLPTGRRHRHPKAANFLLDKRDVVARARKVGGEQLCPWQRQNSEAVRETA